MYLGKELVWRMKQCMLVFFVILAISFLTFNAFADETSPGYGNQGSSVPPQQVSSPVPTAALSGTMPVYRFFNTIALGHFFTIDETEKNYVIAHYPQFRYEGIAFYAYPPDVNVPGTLEYDL